MLQFKIKRDPTPHRRHMTLFAFFRTWHLRVCGSCFVLTMLLPHIGLAGTAWLYPPAIQLCSQLFEKSPSSVKTISQNDLLPIFPTFEFRPLVGALSRVPYYLRTRGNLTDAELFQTMHGLNAHPLYEVAFFEAYDRKGVMIAATSYSSSQHVDRIDGTVNLNALKSMFTFLVSNQMQNHLGKIVYRHTHPHEDKNFFLDLSTNDFLLASTIKALLELYDFEFAEVELSATYINVSKNLERHTIVIPQTASFYDGDYPVRDLIKEDLLNGNLARLMADKNGHMAFTLTVGPSRALPSGSY